ncbi:MAG: type VI secretion system baseplate subunit TssF [Phaeodactylibacter sp.]|nr:type VI secretion system baseplate subunit TssF [Phaeodactylibacter sp.]
MNPFSTDKATIQQRLYKEAAEVYKKYLDHDISNLDRYDPLVHMLISACASEFKIFSGEIQSSQSRMLEHLAQLLTPDAYTGPIPAHGILYAPSAGGNFTTDKYQDHFAYASPSGKDVFFTPTDSFQLLDGRVQYLASGNSFFALRNGMEKEELFRSPRGEALPPGVLWIGLAIAEGCTDIGGVNFYFNLPFEKNYSRLEELLQTSRWKMNDIPLHTQPGLAKAEGTAAPGGFSQFHLMRQHEQEANAYYRGQFLNVSCPDGEDFASFRPLPYPIPLAETFGEEALDKEIKEACFWLQAEFSPAPFSSREALEEMARKMACQVNCFPVLNRRFHTPNFRLGTEVNMFSLRPEGFFYCIEDVKNSRQGKEYIEKPFTHLANQGRQKPNGETSVYALRRDGVHRFDKRASLELMENILQILREESLIYHALGKNVITHNLKSIRKSINDINNKLYAAKEEENLEDKCFVAFPPAEEEYVVVRYWSTGGKAGRNIPAGEPLKSFDASRSGYDEGGIKLTTTTLGGRNRLLEKDRLDAFKSAIVVRDKVVTREDIRLLCYQQAGPEIQSLAITDGSKTGPGPRTGFIRTLDVAIKLRGTPDPQHCRYLAQKLTVELNGKSAGFVPIQVFVD